MLVQSSASAQANISSEALTISPRQRDRDVGFTRLPSDLTGITFLNALSTEAIASNQNFMNGSGVAAGDVNGDGLCDLYFCGITTNNALYLNRGNWHFVEATESAGVLLPDTPSTGAVLVDVDGDSDLDLLVSTLGTGVKLFQNSGNAQFTEITQTAGLSAKTGSTSMALADIDNDGDLDLYVTNYGTIPIVNSGVASHIKRVNGQWTISGPHSDRLRIVGTKLEELGEPDALYLNQGDGTFSAANWNSPRFRRANGEPESAPWEFGLSAQFRDLNGDQAPDLYVCNDFQSPERLWLNDGKGSFQSAEAFAQRKESFASMGVDFADIDRDGHLDFFVVEMLPRGRQQQLRQADGARPVIPQPGRISDRPETNQNTFFLARGDGTYAEIAHLLGLAATDWSWQPVFMDVDLDGWSDLLVVNGMPHNVQDRDTLESIRQLGKQAPDEIRHNFLRYPPYPSSNYAFRNTGQLQFDDRSEDWGFNHHGMTQGIASADLDNDGDLDLVTNNLRESPGIYRNDAQAPRVSVHLQGSPPNTQAIGATLTLESAGQRNQSREIVAGGKYLSASDPLSVFAIPEDRSDATLKIKWRNGDTTTIPHIKANHHYTAQQPNPAPTTNNPQSDSQPVTPKPWFSDVSHLLKHEHQERLFNDFTRQPLLPRMLSQDGPGIAWVDLDGDLHDELIIGAGARTPIGVYRRQASGTFHSLTGNNPLVAPDDTTGIAPWVSAEGHRTTFVGVSNYESDPQAKGVILSVGLGNKVPTMDQLGETSPGPLAVGDMDSDGDLDVFVGGKQIPGAYPRSTPPLIFRQENGTLKIWKPAQNPLAQLGLVNGALWSDLNADGRPELITCSEWGEIQIHRYENGKLMRDDPLIRATSDETDHPQRLSDLTGWWLGIATADFDNDGRLDLVAGNWGENSRWQTTREHPLELHFGNPVVPQRTDLFMSQFDPSENQSYSETDFNTLRQLIPTTAGFLSHGRFSTLNMDDFLKVIPGSLTKRTIATLSSTLFLNRGDHFLAHPLPRKAQFSPVFSVNVADFNADGNEDLFLSQNFSAFRPGQTRQDAGVGLILQGNGKGAFGVLDPKSAGFAIHGEQRGAAVGDFNEDGRADLVVTQNAGPTRLLKNTSPRRGLLIKLIGPPNNLDAIGAKLQFRNPRHLRPVRELQSGSAYWSSNSRHQVLAMWPDDNALEVHWPDGTTTAHSVQAAEEPIVIRYPLD